MLIYLLRVNLDVVESDLKNSKRVKEAISTIKALSKKNNKVVILSHRGRPKNRDKNLTLKPFTKIISNAVSKKVVFLDDVNLDISKKRIFESHDGSIFLLENLRFLKGEIKNNASLSKKLSELGTVFINDDFSTSHRENASTIGIAKFLKTTLGPNFKKEILNLNKVVRNPKRPLVVIIGGAKISDKLGAMNNLLPKAKYVLLGGGPANTLLKVFGLDIKKSIYDSEMVNVAKKLIKNKKIIMPIDWIFSDNKILDIGSETTNFYETFLSEAKTIVWGGPLGLFENEKFAVGTNKIAKFISKTKAFSVVGGGDTVDAITRIGLENKFGFVSSGGGAMLEYLGGKKPKILKYIKK